MAKKTNRFLNFFKEVKGELKKVVWPSFKQVKNNTLIVIACVVIIGIFIALLDGVFSLTFGKVIEKLQGGEAVEQTVDGAAGDANQLTPEQLEAMMEASGMNTEGAATENATTENAAAEGATTEGTNTETNKTE